MSNIYLDLTAQFNSGRRRAIISSGQAVVLHRLAIMSKDGDWILREDAEALDHVLGTLAAREARYRFGAPLDLRWMRGGWSAHFEFRLKQLRVRTDFVTRPPRLEPARIAQFWQSEETPAVLDPISLADIKKTNREKDYVVIAELARLMDPGPQLLYSRSARDLQKLAGSHPDLAQELSAARPLLALTGGERSALEEALDAERRQLIRANEERLTRYRNAAQAWADAWPALEKEIAGRGLRQAHEILVSRALELLPFAP